MKTKILVIEDNAQNMYLVTYILEMNGFHVIQANNGMDGINTARQEIPNLVLLDIQLPVMDGYTVARELRKIDALIQTPIVAVTSYAMPGDRENALAAGCSGYIEKPINPDTFISQIRQYLHSTEFGESK
jgi:two-component system, cell cycle response regulator DivK